MHRDGFVEATHRNFGDRIGDDDHLVGPSLVHFEQNSTEVPESDGAPTIWIRTLATRFVDSNEKACASANLGGIAAGFRDQ